MMTNIPVNKIVKSEKNKLNLLSKKIAEKLIGQKNAIENMDKEIQREKIIGIGIGVNLVESPESVNFKASSLKQELKKHIDRDQFLLILEE